MAFLRRELPLIIVGSMAVLQIFEYLFGVPILKGLGSEMRVWQSIIVSYSLLMGTIGGLRVHYKQITRRTPGKWLWSIYFIAFFLLVCAIGFGYGTSSTLYMWLYEWVTTNLWNTMVSTAGFYILYGALRAFRARNSESALMLIVGAFIILQMMPIVKVMFRPAYDLGYWFLNVPAVGAQRGLIICAGVGMIMLTFRSILGYERAFLGLKVEEDT